MIKPGIFLHYHIHARWPQRHQLTTLDTVTVFENGWVPIFKKVFDTYIQHFCRFSKHKMKNAWFLCEKYCLKYRFYMSTKADENTRKVLSAHNYGTLFLTIKLSLDHYYSYKFCHQNHFNLSLWSFGNDFLNFLFSFV